MIPISDSIMRSMTARPFLACIIVLLAASDVQAFAPQRGVTRAFTPSSLRVAVRPEADLDTRSFLLSREEVKPIFSFGKDGSEKVVNPFGLWCLFVSLITGPIWMLAMKVVHQMENDENRAMYDMTGKIWAKTWLTMTNSYPTVSGNMERLKAGNQAGPCLFVANHASWLDIPVLCTVLDPVFKFIAKGELAKVPCIGTQLSGGEHILIDREDRRSQLKTFKQGIEYLKKGVPIMAFPEGQRSKDGHLMEFKGGIFAMATKTNVPIVPITLSHTHAVMPGNSLFPVQPGWGKLHVHVHDPIVATGKSEAELADLVRASFLKTLPLEQHPLEFIPTAEELQALSQQQSDVSTGTSPSISV